MSARILPPLDFVARALDRAGAVTGPASEGLEALLPEPLARGLGLDEAVLLTATSGAGISAGYGSDLLTRLAQSAIDGGRVCCARATASTRAPDPPYAGLNVSLATSRAGAGEANVLTGIFHVVADGDEQRRTSIRSTVALPSGTSVPWADAVRLERTACPTLGREGLGRGLAKLSEAAARDAMLAAEPFHKAARGRLARDAARLDKYFADLERDLAERARAGRAPAFASKLSTIAADRERRRDQLVLTYRLKITLAPVTILLVVCPAELARITVKRREHTRTFDVKHLSTSRAWEPIPCDGCGRSAYAFALCDAARHALCGACHDACGTGGRRPCFRCEDKPRPTSGGAGERSL